jgi:hypothetical protein
MRASGYWQARERRHESQMKFKQPHSDRSAFDAIVRAKSRDARHRFERDRVIFVRTGTFCASFGHAMMRSTPRA